MALSPDPAMAPGDYVVRVNTKLEDLAGNNLRRLFDEDVSDGAQTRAATSIELPFKIR